MKRCVRRCVIGGVAVLLLLAVAIVMYRVGYQAYLKAAYPLKYEELVTRYAEENELPPSLVYAVIHTESRFNEQAVSSAGAKGLMQLMDATYTWVQTRIPGDDEPLEQVFDPEVNIRCGCKVLQIVMSQFDNTQTALAAYNAGSGNVSKWLKNEEYSDDGVTLKYIPVEETREYVGRVLKAQKMYQTMYETDGEES